MSFRPFVAAALLFAPLAACAPEAPDTGSDESSVTDDEELSGDTVYVVTRQDFRKCSYPMCGGVYVKAVNKQKTKCADGTKQAECYVAGINVGPMELPEAQASDVKNTAISGRILLSGQYTTVNGSISELSVFKAWEPRVNQIDPTGTHYLVESSGIVCIKAPCPSIRATNLNGTADSKNLTGIDFKLLQISEEEKSDYLSRAFQTGVVMTGTIKTFSTSQGQEKQLKVTEVFTQIEPKVEEPAQELCLQDSACGEGEYCDHTECFSNCPEGMVCPAVCYGQCLPEAPEPQPELCLQDSACGEGEYCDHTECFSNCPEGMVCPAVCYGQCLAGDGPAPAADSCESACGGASADASCYCDDSCEYYGDCCGDFAQFCGN